MNPKSAHVYFSFANLLVKTDLKGKVLGTMDGFTGHLADLHYTADMDGNGTFDGNTGKTADHRYGGSGATFGKVTK